MFTKILSVFLGGGIGSVLRFVVNTLSVKYLQCTFPFATFIVNIVGSFILGFFFAWFLLKGSFSPNVKLFIIVGFCGGLTTFSTFSKELFELLSSANYVQAFLYLFLSVLLSVLFVFMGGCVAKFV